MCPQGPPVLQQQENANHSNDSCNNATTHNSHNVWSDPFYGDIPGPKAPGCIRVHCVNTGPLPINGKDDAKYGDLFAALQQHDSDIVLLQELGTNWSHMKSPLILAIDGKRTSIYTVHLYTAGIFGARDVSIKGVTPDIVGVVSGCIIAAIIAIVGILLLLQNRRALGTTEAHHHCQKQQWLYQ